MPAAGWASQEEIAASASGIEKGTIEYPGIGGNPQKGPQREPREADKIGSRQHGFEPGSAFLVLFGSWMVGVEQQVRVDEDQR
jgi:hypothetical protein